MGKIDCVDSSKSMQLEPWNQKNNSLDSPGRQAQHGWKLPLILKCTKKGDSKC